MFCVIQEIITKRENPPGFSKRLEVTHYTTYAEDGTEQIKWGYVYSDECFERPVKKSYKVSVHQSYRDKDGKPRKKEFVLFTVKYYDLATGEFDTYNWGAEKIEKVAIILGVSEEEIYKAVESKIRPLELELQEEFQQTEESQTYRRNLRIVLEYERKKRQFNMGELLQEYRVSSELQAIQRGCYFDILLEIQIWFEEELEKYGVKRYNLITIEDMSEIEEFIPEREKTEELQKKMLCVIVESIIKSVRNRCTEAKAYKTKLKPEEKILLGYYLTDLLKETELIKDYAGQVVEIFKIVREQYPDVDDFIEKMKKKRKAAEGI